MKKENGLTTRVNSFSTVSMFSGCGGLDLGVIGGFEYKNKKYSKNPFEIIKAYDFNPHCVETYKNNIGDHIELADLSSKDPFEIPKADILMGGFPCQDFSSCGPKKGLNSERGRLYQALIRYMNAHSPMIVIGENVPHLEKIDKGNAIKQIVSELSEAGPGYNFQVWKLYGPDYGLPQTRTRLFFIGTRADLPFAPEIPKPTHTDGFYNSIDWAINDLVKIKDDRVPNQSQYFKASIAKRGNGQGDEKNQKGLPSYTVRANAKSRVHFHYSLDRRLTVRECARLQTFPDDFIFTHSATSNIMQIGNAVPPILGHVVAKSIATYLRENDLLPGQNLKKKNIKTTLNRAYEAVL